MGYRQSYGKNIPHKHYGVSHDITVNLIHSFQYQDTSSDTYKTAYSGWVPKKKLFISFKLG